MEENREPLSAIAIEKKLQLLRNKHFSEDTIALVKSDYEYGLKEEEISLYLNKSYDIEQMKILSECLHKDVPKDVMNKKFSNLKMKQKDKITGWVYEEYKKYVAEHEKAPDSLADEQIVEAVLDKINEAQIWIPDGEIYDYYRRKKPQLQKRLDSEKLIEFKSYVSFYKSIVDQDRASVVICNLKHEIIYMNPAAVTSYAKRGGDKLIGRSLLDCHNPESRDRIQQVVDWFAADERHNIVYTFHNEKQNKDVYMVALRDEGNLIGYYEKHEYRNSETMKPYDLW